jgi:hypothetical protein
MVSAGGVGRAKAEIIPALATLAIVVREWRALQLFPSAHALLALKKDHGRAEASLIALFGAQQ